MKKARFFAVVGALMLLAAPSYGAGGTNVWTSAEFTTVAPCAAACPYWLDSLNGDYDSDAEDDVAFDACGNPGGTSGSTSDVPAPLSEEGIFYDDLAVGSPPEDAQLLFVEIHPHVDWDVYICTTDGRDAGACGGPISECSILVGDTCDNRIGPNNPVPVGCSELHGAAVSPSLSYVIRAYNFADPFPLEGRYCWSSSAQC